MRGELRQASNRFRSNAEGLPLLRVRRFANGLTTVANASTGNQRSTAVRAHQRNCGCAHHNPAHWSCTRSVVNGV